MQVIPLQVFINERTIRDGQMSPAELFRLVEQTKKLPQTSAPSIQEFINLFDTPDEKIFIGISNKLSSTTPNAIIAAQNLNGPKIHIIDSLNLSTGIGLLVLKAAELRDQGMSAQEITQHIESLIPNIHTTFLIDTLDYLYKGGRCSAMQHVMGSLLKIRPVIEVRPDGTLAIKEKIGGARKKALNSMLADFKSHLPNIDLHRIFVSHTGCDADAEYIADQLCQLAPIEEICITVAGATVSSHCGPNTIGLIYLLKPN